MMNPQQIDDLVQQIARELGDHWVAKHNFLIRQDGLMLSITQDPGRTLRNHNRVKAEGEYRLNDELLDNFMKYIQKPYINFTPTRPVPQLVNELRLRLIPGVEEARKQAIANKEAYEADRWAEDAIAVNLRNVLGERYTEHNGRRVKRIFSRPGQRNFEVSASVMVERKLSQPYIQVAIDGLTQSEAEEILAWCRKINPPANDLE